MEVSFLYAMRFIIAKIIAVVFTHSQVVQIIEQPAARHVWPQRFLRLADDRGWVLENHPKVFSYNY